MEGEDWAGAFTFMNILISFILIIIKLIIIFRPRNNNNLIPFILILIKLIIIIRSVGRKASTDPQ